MSKKSKKSIGAAFEELETITKEFEAGEIDLDQALPKMKKAAELSKFLKKRLSDLESQIEKIDIDEEK